MKLKTKSTPLPPTPKKKIKNIKKLMSKTTDDKKFGKKNKHDRKFSASMSQGSAQEGCFPPQGQGKKAKEGGLPPQLDGKKSTRGWISTFTKERKTVTRVGRGWWFELGLVGWLSVPSTAETVAPSLPPYPPYQNCSQAMREAWVPDPTETKQQSGRVEKPAETFDEYCNLASAKAVYADGFLLQALATKLQTTDTIIWKYANGAWDRCN